MKDEGEEAQGPVESLLYEQNQLVTSSQPEHKPVLCSLCAGFYRQYRSLAAHSGLESSSHGAKKGFGSGWNSLTQGWCGS